MGARITAANDALQLTLELSDGEGPRALRGELTFPERSQAESATVALALFGNSRAAELVDRPDRMDAEALLTPNPARLERSSAPARFKISLPPIARDFAGANTRIHVGVLATPDHGPPLRLRLDPAPPPAPSGAALRQVPRTEFVRFPLAFLLGLLVSLAGLALLVVALITDGALPGQLGLGGTVVGGLAAIFLRRGVSLWLRVGRTQVDLEEEDAANGKGLRVIVRGGPRLSGGSARLEAFEYERYEGAETEGPAIAFREDELVRGADGAWTATLPLPAPGEAPPSTVLSGPMRVLAIRWRVTVSLVNRSGATGRASLPIQVVHLPVR